MTREEKILKKIDVHTRWLESWEKSRDGLSTSFKRGSGKSMNFSCYSWEVQKSREKLARDITHILDKV